MMNRAVDDLGFRLVIDANDLVCQVVVHQTANEFEPAGGAGVEAGIIQREACRGAGGMLVVANPRPGNAGLCA